MDVSHIDFTSFRNKVRRHYRAHGRHDLPWRLTRDPYSILVSEVMLQQTQVPRVLHKYDVFLKRFPNIALLAAGERREVFALWQGLGYNRRAKMLHECAQMIVEYHQSVIPDNVQTLTTLPGIGEYTASAVVVFAYNKPAVLVETNIRTVFFHHFYPDSVRVSDIELKALVRAALPPKKIREWYWALMDYGAFLKERGVKKNMQSVHYKTQSRFKGSTREIRGAIVRMLTAQGTASLCDMARVTGFSQKALQQQLKALHREGVVQSVRVSGVAHYTL